MSIKIEFIQPAAADNPELRAGEISTLLINDSRGRFTIKGKVTPVASVASVGLSALSSYLINGRMQHRMDQDHGSDAVWREPKTEAPKLTDFIGPFMAVTLAGDGTFEAEVLMHEGDNTLSVLATDTSGNQHLSQLRVTVRRGEVFPGQLMASDALKAAQHDPRITPSLNENIPPQGTID